MKWSVFFAVLISNCVSGQCFQPTNATATISGLYTSNINLPPGNIIYVAPNATVTGNIYLNNSSLVNCGTILSKKIHMKQSLTNWQHTFYNMNEVNCDSVICDTMGHIHNLAVFTAHNFNISYYSSVDNYYIMEGGKIKVNNSDVSSFRDLKCNSLLLENSSRFMSQNSNILVKKLIDIDLSSDLTGSMQVCIDSAFINNGNVMAYVSTNTFTSSMTIMGSSINFGTIMNLDICDLSLGNSGPDQNFGILSNVTFCDNSATGCNFYSTEIIEKKAESLKVAVFPNPTTDILYINENDMYDLGEASFEIFNSLGQVVISGEFKNEINVSRLSQGFYSLKIRQKNGPMLYSNFIK